MNIETSFAPLLDLLVKSAALILIGTALLAMLRKTSAANRHAISAAIFAALLLLPLTKLMPARWSFALEKPAAATVRVRLPLTATVHSSGESAAASSTENAAQPAPRTPLVIPWKTLALSVWFGGAALLLLRRAFIAIRLRAVVRGSEGIEDERLATAARELVEAGGVRAEVRESSRCHVPLVAGILRPVVLIPADAKDWDDALISSALRHELGHIRRRDCITRLLADFVCAFYWLNPLVWFAARQMRLAQEQACDDLVLNAGAPADEYAEQLVNVVRSLQGDRFTARHALAMAQPSTLETRVLAIVDTQRDRSARSVRGTFAGITFIAASLAICTAAQLRGADEKKAAPAAGANAPAVKQVLIRAKFVEITGNDPALPKILKSVDPKVASVLGILTDDEASKMWRALNQPKGVDLLSAPSVTTKSKQNVLVEVVREYKFANEWRTNPQTGVVEPSAFGSRDVGVKFGATPEVGADGIITLNMKPEIVELEGLVDLDADANAIIGKPDAKLPAGERVMAMTDMTKIPKGHRTQPVFNVRKMEANVAVRSGQTIVLGGMDRTDVQTVEDTDPKTGRTKTTQVHLTRRLFVMVTASIVDPAEAPPVPAGQEGAASGPKPLNVVSDEMTLDKKTGTLSASGNVRIETAQATITAAAAEIAPKKTGTGPAEAVQPGPQGGSDAMFLREWKVPPGLFQAGNVGDSGKSAVQDSLEKKGVTFGAGATAVFNQERSSIVVRNTQAQLDRIERFIVDSVQSVDTPAAPVNSAAPAGEAKPGETLVFPTIEFRDATVRECVDFLVAKSKGIDPKGTGVNILIKDADKIGDVRITISLKEIPLAEVLRYVAGLANCELVREKFAFVIRPMEAGKVPAPLVDVEVGTKNAPVFAADALAKLKGAALKKAGTIIFPKLDLRDATLSETVDFLREKSKALDPDKQGVNLILRPGGTPRKITVNLTNIPLSEALHYAVDLAGFEFVADDHAITIRPRVK